MPTFSATQTLSAAAPQVFAFLADARNMPRWNSGVAEVDDCPTEPCEGAEYRYRFPGRHRFHQLVCCAYRAPSLLCFRGERMWTPLGTQSVAFTFRVRDGDGGTTIEETVDVTLHGGMLLTLPIITLGWRRDLPEDMARLRETLEPGSTPPSAPAEERLSAPAVVNRSATPVEDRPSSPAADLPSAPAAVDRPSTGPLASAPTDPLTS